MAASNRDRIGQMYDALAPALDAFITAVLGPQLPPPGCAECCVGGGRGVGGSGGRGGEEAGGDSAQVGVAVQSVRVGEKAVRHFRQGSTGAG